MATLHINPPEDLHFQHRQVGRNGKPDLKDIELLLVYHPKHEKKQVNSLIYVLGEQAEDIFSSFSSVYPKRKKIILILC